MILSVAILTLPVSAEEAEENKDVWNDYGDYTLREDRTYRGFLNSEPTSLDPGRASDNYSITILFNIGEPLVLLHNDKDGNAEFLAGGATWEISEDGTVYTFHLRDNKWWDGEPVTAEQYAYGILRTLNPETGSPYSYLLEPILNAAKYLEQGASEEEIPEDEKVKEEDLGVKVIDEKTLEITLEAPTATFLEVCGNPIMHALREDYIEKYAEQYGTDADKVMGNGPFKVSEWTHNNKIVLEKADTYWNAENVFYDKIEDSIMSETNTIMNAFDVGEIYSAGVSSAEWKERFAARDDIEYKEIGQPGTFFMMFNTNDPDEIFTNAKVRRAFSACLDREEINDVIWYGNFLPAMGWVAPAINVGSINYRETAPNFVEKLREDVEDPKALLDEGLTELGKEDLIDNLEVTITLGGTDQWFKDFGEYFQQVMMEELNVNLRVDQQEWTVFSSRKDQGDYQIGYMAWGSELSEPNALLLIHVDGSGQVGTQWNNEEYNELIRKAQIEQDEEKRFEIYQAAEEILMEEAPVAPVVHPVANQYYYSFVKNQDWHVFSNMGSRQGFLVEEE